MFARLAALAITIAATGAVGAVWAGDPPPSVAQDVSARPPMALGAASNFSTGWNEATFNAARALGVREFRDAIRWADVERAPGRYSFDQRKTRYAETLAASGAHLVLTVSGANPLYDEGQTPHSPEGVAAFARFVAASVAQFPAVSAVEVGNEFNGPDYVTGPVRQGGIAQRARYHLALAEAVSREVARVRPEVAVLGGATHSLPAGYLWAVADGAAAGTLDGLAVHPYSTPIDQLRAQTEVLRRNPRARALPLYVTEWGTSDEDEAPDHLVRGYAAMASLGYAALDWYPLNERGDRMVPLIRRDGSISPAGQAFRLVATELAGRSARDVSPDPFTFVHQFGEDRLVLWGAPRPVVLARPDIMARDARGRVLDRAALALEPEKALVLSGERPLRIGTDVLLGCSTLVADSYYQFAFPRSGAPAPGDGLTASFGAQGAQRPLVTMPGQQRAGVPWMPYLGAGGGSSVRLTARSMFLPAATGDAEQLIIDSPVPAGTRLRLEGEVVPAPLRGSEAQFSMRIEAHGRAIFTKNEPGPARFDIPLPAGFSGNIRLFFSSVAGRPLSARYRFRLHDDALCAR